MQKLVRDKNGELIVTEVEDITEIRSPIVTETNVPVQAVVLKMPVKADLKDTLLTEAQLLLKMQEAGGKNLNTSQFAILITPHIKNSVDPARYHKWDLALAHIRSLMQSLEAQGKVTKTKDSTSKRVRYLYNLI